MGNTVVWKPAGTAMLSAYYLMRLFQEAGLPDGVINLVYGSGATIGDAALASPHLAGIHFTGSTPVFNGMWRTVASNMERYRNYPRIVGETGGKDFIVAHPSADVDVARGRDRARLVRVPGAEVLGASSRVYAPSNLWPELRERLAGGGRDDQGRRRRRLRQLHGRRDRRARRSRRRREAIEEAKAQRRQRHRRRRRLRRLEGLLRRADRDRDARPATSGCCARRSSARSSPRTSTTRTSGTTRSTLVDRTAPYGLTGAVFAQDRAAAADAQDKPPLRGGQLLRQRQADRRRRRPAAVRRRARLGHERQGGLDVEPDPLGQPAHDQGDVRAAAATTATRSSTSDGSRTTKTRVTAVRRGRGARVGDRDMLAGASAPSGAP